MMHKLYCICKINIHILHFQHSLIPLLLIRMQIAKKWNLKCRLQNGDHFILYLNVVNFQSNEHRALCTDPCD